MPQYRATNTTLDKFDVGDYGAYIIDYQRKTLLEQAPRVEVPEDIANQWAVSVGHPLSTNKEFVCVHQSYRVCVFLYWHDFNYWLYSFTKEQED
jgi:hypothetical protein